MPSSRWSELNLLLFSRPTVFPSRSRVRRGAREKGDSPPDEVGSTSTGLIEFLLLVCLRRGRGKPRPYPFSPGRGTPRPYVCHSSRLALIGSQTTPASGPNTRVARPDSW